MHAGSQRRKRGQLKPYRAVSDMIKDLRCHVSTCPSDAADIFGSRPQSHCQSKVTQGGSVLPVEDVCWLYISVYDSLIMQVRQSLQDLLRQPLKVKLIHCLPIVEDILESTCTATKQNLLSCFYPVF